MKNTVTAYVGMQPVLLYVPEVFTCKARPFSVIWKMANPSTLQCRICLKYVVNVKSHLWIKFDMYMYQQPILIYQKDRTLQRANSGFKLLNNIKVHFEIFRWLSSWALISLISVTHVVQCQKLHSFISAVPGVQSACAVHVSHAHSKQSHVPPQVLIWHPIPPQPPKAMLGLARFNTHNYVLKAHIANYFFHLCHIPCKLTISQFWSKISPGSSSWPYFALFTL